MNKPVLFFVFSTIFLQYSYSQDITKSVRIRSGAVNGVLIEKNGKNLVVYGDPKDDIKHAEMVLFTHFRRDVVWAGRNLVQNGSLAVIPAKEKAYFLKGDSIWQNYEQIQFHDYYNQTTKIGIFPFKDFRYAEGGETLKWQDIDIKVLNTPGYTRGSVSYIINIDRKRYAFVGDLIYDDGKILDLYSFQDSVQTIRSYHGYATRLAQLITSLQLIAQENPDFIIPSRGPIIKNPNQSIQKLIQQIRLVYQNYLSISAIRWHFGQEKTNFLAQRILRTPDDIIYMPFSSVIQRNPPSWDMHISNTNLVFAADSSAFLIDCGTTESTFKKIVQMKQSGRLKKLDGIFITHYHDDHTDFLNEFVKEFHCPVYVTKELKDILENPSAYHMPCLTTEPISNLTIVQNGEKKSWKDFNLTFLFFPGQTLYHDAILFEKNNGESIFFIGDSFTPSGIDDYCMLNRNLLHPDTGFLYCLDILKKLPENVLLSNQHVGPLFAFSRQQLDYMKKVLIERNVLLKDLFPWDNVNYGVDEQWVSVYPYSQNARPGQTVDFSVKIFNHSEVSKTYILKPNVPNGFNLEPNNAKLVIAPRTEGTRTFKILISKQPPEGVSLLTVDVKFDNWDLREWSEGLIKISP